ncbi:MAG: alpha-ketoglutarate-dependent dioxygenase AlkB [Alphaproteobacteria bacterium]|nr:alpha-ketoglutarate-dependent dioxygenase AlkB [Alphaproteobacteria bacterium]
MSKATTCSAPSAEPAAVNLLPLDGEAYLIENVLSPKEADCAFADLLKHADWRQEHAVLFGRKIALPRLTAWYGSHGYAYSGIQHEPAPLTPMLATLKLAIENITKTRFDSVLLNLYRDGGDSMGWHSDDEKALGPEPIIASLSLGAERRFHLRHRTGGERVALKLGHGSCLIMKGRCQACWRHQLPKTRRKIGPRINLTFRTIRR